jgi:hypothetical protein
MAVMTLFGNENASVHDVGRKSKSGCDARKVTGRFAISAKTTVAARRGTFPLMPRASYESTTPRVVATFSQNQHTLRRINLGEFELANRLWRYPHFTPLNPPAYPALPE